MAYNSDYFNFSNWRLTIPVDSTGSISGTAVEIPNLKGYESPYFYDAPDGAMVFTAAVNGATTSGSSYARSELREMKGTERAAWKLSEGGTMTATLKVDAAPTLSNGTPGKLIVGQIHGKNEELIRLYWENNKLYFRNDQAGPSNSEMTFTFKNASGKEPNVSLGETFSYKIDARGDTLTVDIYADGQLYNSTTKINSIWQSDTLYFKAGVYLGVNETQGTGSGQTSFYGLDFGHTPGSGLGGWRADGTPSPQPEPEPQPVPTDPNLPPPTVSGTPESDILKAKPDVDNVILGGAGHDRITGHDGNDQLYGQTGIDWINGYWGNDMLDGGAEDDTLDGWQGDDTLIGGTGNDIATGGVGKDTFVVNRGDQGLIINDFSASDDRVVVKGFTALQLQGAELSQSGANVLLKLSDGSTVLFLNITTSKLTAENLLAEVNGKLVGLTTGAQQPDPEPEPEPEPNPDPVPTPDPTVPTPTMTGTAGNDRLDGVHGKFNNVIMGGAGNDNIIGHDGADKLYGDDGNDTINAYWGNDMLYGGAGSDKLDGGNGDDVLSGGAGKDTLTGGSGSDTFVFTSLDIADVITDFKVGQDHLDISALLGDNGTAELRKVSGKTALFVDQDGAGSAQAVLAVTFDGSSNVKITHNLHDILI